MRNSEVASGGTATAAVAPPPSPPPPTTTVALLMDEALLFPKAPIDCPKDSLGDNLDGAWYKTVPLVVASGSFWPSTFRLCAYKSTRTRDKTTKCTFEYRSAFKHTNAK
jgi:hypothetical protein